MTKISDFYSKHKRIIEIVFLAVLCLFPFLKIRIGLDVTDTGYSLGNYEAFPHDVGTWKAATYLAGAIGWLFTKLPFGQTMLGMKFYTTLIITACCTIAYFNLRKYVPTCLLFVGELIALGLCWCPVTILYNYLTYLLFTLGALFLLKGLTEEKNGLVVLAGVMLGMNIFVRFPNLAQMALILVVWYYCYLRGIERKKQKKEGQRPEGQAGALSGWCLGLKLTGLAVAGYLIGILILLAIISLDYGFTRYFEMIPRLFAIGDDNSSYTPIGMILGVLNGYYGTLKWGALLAVPAVIVSLIFPYIKKKSLRIVTLAAESLIYLCLLYVYHHILVFYHNYNDYQSIYFFATLLLMLGIISAVLTMFRKKSGIREKILAAINLILIGITPLGSNNGLYPNFNNLFIVAPVTLYLLWNMVGISVWERLTIGTRNTHAVKAEDESANTHAGKAKDESANTHAGKAEDESANTRAGKMDRNIPIVAAFVIVFAAIVFQSVLFGCVFTFRDTGFLTGETKSQVVNNERLKGMLTNSQNADELSKIGDFLSEYRELGVKGIFYGDIPALSYYMEIPGAISHTWANLPSYSYRDMEVEMEQVEDALIILNQDWYPDLEAVETASRTDKKLKLLYDFIIAHDYKLIYGENGYNIFYLSSMDTQG